MKLIVGLGNPGEEYTRTRHNIGRRLVEFIAGKERAAFASRKSRSAAEADLIWGDEKLHLTFPLTYMNLSGVAVAALVKYWKIAAEKDLLIVVDDIALPFGKFRLRGEGSPGGHNGLASIEEHLGSRRYARLRIGIGSGENVASRDRSGELRDYVLSAFTALEEKKMSAVLEKGMEGCRLWATGPLTQAMNRINAPV